MEADRARALLTVERARVERLLNEEIGAASSDRQTEDEQGGDIADPAERLTAEGLDDALVASLRERLAALDRAETRLREGTFGLSIRSGRPITDERLEADPAAELTLDEAEEDAAG